MRARRQACRRTRSARAEDSRIYSSDVYGGRAGPSGPAAARAKARTPHQSRVDTFLHHIEPDVPGDDAIAVKRRDEAGEREKRPVWKRITQVTPPRENDKKPDDGAGNRREHQSDEHELPPEERADHREHLDVAPTHAFLPRVAIVRLANEPERSAADQNADRRR